MKVYDELPDSRLYRREKRSVAVLEGWLDKMDEIPLGKWLLCLEKEMVNNKSSHIYSIRTNQMKIHPDYEWEVRRISETKHGLFGRRKQ